MGNTSSDGPPSAHGAIARRIDHAHGRIREILEQASAASPELSQTRALLDGLPEILHKHFDDEEHEGGLFDTLRVRQPSVDPQLKLLQREHRYILQAVEALEAHLERLERIEDAAERDERMALIQRETVSLIEELRLHERTESRLVADILYLDEGGSG